MNKTTNKTESESAPKWIVARDAARFLMATRDAGPLEIDRAYRAYVAARAALATKGAR